MRQLRQIAGTRSNTKRRLGMNAGTSRIGVIAPKIEPICPVRAQAQMQNDGQKEGFVLGRRHDDDEKKGYQLITPGPSTRSMVDGADGMKARCTWIRRVCSSRRFGNESTLNLTVNESAFISVRA